VQETCICACQWLDMLKKSGVAKAWLLRVMHNLLVDGTRRVPIGRWVMVIPLTPALPRCTFTERYERDTDMQILLTEFARPRLFPREQRPNTIQGITAVEFERYLNDHLPLKVLDGYAPFCKLHVHRNWTATRCLTAPVTEANRHLLRSAYEARNSNELPVLVRWFEGIDPPIAAYLIAILYSREQLSKEGSPITADWGVVGCMYTQEPEEIPMAPITMMRNALGVNEGGSGVPLDHAQYRRSVDYWASHANWR
jgi:hypothetical protein